VSLFITFEGGEGCGKSTQARALYRRLIKLGISVELTHEPGGTMLGKKLRGLLKSKDMDYISPEAELLLFAASRAQLIQEVIQPGLQTGKVIICDRFADSTTAYQGYGRGIELSKVDTVNHLASFGIKPDLTVLLEMPADKGLSRKNSRNLDRFEIEDIGFHDTIRDGYLKLVAQEPERWLLLDASSHRKQIEHMIWERVSQLFGTRGILLNA
jgi:dTMP kinase